MGHNRGKDFSNAGQRFNIFPTTGQRSAVNLPLFDSTKQGSKLNLFHSNNPDRDMAKSHQKLNNIIHNKRDGALYNPNYYNPSHGEVVVAHNSHKPAGKLTFVRQNMTLAGGIQARLAEGATPTQDPTLLQQLSDFKQQERSPSPDANANLKLPDLDQRRNSAPYMDYQQQGNGN